MIFIQHSLDSTCHTIIITYNTIQAAIYPVLAGHYIVKSIDSEAIPRQLLSEFVLLVVVCMRLFDFAGLTKYVCVYVFVV